MGASASTVTAPTIISPRSSQSTKTGGQLQPIPPEKVPHSGAQHHRRTSLSQSQSQQHATHGQHQPLQRTNSISHSLNPHSRKHSFSQDRSVVPNPQNNTNVTTGGLSSNKGAFLPPISTSTNSTTPTNGSGSNRPQSATRQQIQQQLQSSTAPLSNRSLTHQQHHNPPSASLSHHSPSPYSDSPHSYVNNPTLSQNNSRGQYIPSPSPPHMTQGNYDSPQRNYAQIQMNNPFMEVSPRSGSYPNQPQQPPYSHSASNSLNSSTFVQPFYSNSLSPTSGNGHTHSNSNGNPSFTPLPPFSTGPPPNVVSARQRKSLAIHTSMDATIQPIPPPTSYQPLPPGHIVFDTTLADSRQPLPSSGVASPISNSISPEPQLFQQRLAFQQAQLIDAAHPFLLPFGQQQTHAMQVEEDMEYIMDRPIPTVSLETDSIAQTKPGERRSRKTLSSLGMAAVAAAAAAGATATSPERSTSQTSYGSTPGTNVINGPTSSSGSVLSSPYSMSNLDSGRPMSGGSSPLHASSGQSSTSAIATIQDLVTGAQLSPRQFLAPNNGGLHYLPNSDINSSASSTTSLQLAAVAESLPIDIALPIVQAAMYDEASPDYQQYKSAWLIEKEAAAKEAQRLANIEKAIQQGLLPKHHVRRSSRSMFGDSPGCLSSGATSPWGMGSPQQPSSPLAMSPRSVHSGMSGSGLPPTHNSSGYMSPLHARSLSPMGSPHSPTIFATLLESNSRNASRAISPAPLSPLSTNRESLGMNLAALHLPPSMVPQGRQTSAHQSRSQSVHRHPSEDLTSATAGQNHHANQPSHGQLDRAASPASSQHSGGSSGPSSPPRHPEPALYATYDNLRLGWIPSDLALTGAIPVPYK